MIKPLMIDLYAGLGGWAEGGLAEGYRVVGFDIERHRYPARVPLGAEGTKNPGANIKLGESRTPGDSRSGSFNYANECLVREQPFTGCWTEYPAQLVIQDVLTIHGSQFKSAALIVASPPCQDFSYMAMPWSRAKAIAADYRSGKRDVKKLTALFDACFRIQREASEAAGHHIPMVVENVRGAQKWVGRSRWNFGSFHLWGDVPALMPIQKRREAQKMGNGTAQRTEKGRSAALGNYDQLRSNQRESYSTVTKDGVKKVPGFRFDGSGKSFQTASVEGTKTPGRSLNKDAGAKFGTHNMGSADAIFAELGVKQPGIGGPRANGKGDAWSQDGAAKHGSKSNARKAASAMIAKIPLTLSRHIAKVYHP